MVDQGRYLYHGTSAQSGKKILNEGIRPRGKTKGNWNHCPSHSGAVYLTSVYAVHYAKAASNGGTMAIVEVELDDETKHNLYPDEDFVARVFHEGKLHRSSIREYTTYPPPGLTLKEMTVWVRDRLRCYGGCGWESIRYMGTACVIGNIPARCVRRVAFVNPNDPIAALSDPVIGPQNYQIMGRFYHVITQALMKEEINVEDWMCAKFHGIQTCQLIGMMGKESYAREYSENARLFRRIKTKVVENKHFWNR